MEMDGQSVHYAHMPTCPHNAEHWTVPDGCPKEGDHTPLLLTYASTLQCMGEATEGRTWCPTGMCFTLQISLLINAFIEETGGELIELDIASCWGQPLEEVLRQKDDGPFVDVISYLDGLAQHMPTRKTWDELVFPPPLAEPHTPRQSSHLGYILGHTMDLGSTLPPPLRFHITNPNGEFLCVARGLLFEGSVLTYDPATNGAEWIPVRGTVNDLSPMEDGCALELSNITIPDFPEDAPLIDHFRQHW